MGSAGRSIGAVDGRFPLGTRTQNSRGSRQVSRHVFRVRGRSAVYLQVESETGGELLLVAPCVPLSLLVEEVYRPDGSRVDPGTLSIEAMADAVAAADPDRPDEWRTVPIHVKVSCEGYAPLEFDWTLDGDHPRRTLVRR